MLGADCATGDQECDMCSLPQSGSISFFLARSFQHRVGTFRVARRTRLRHCSGTVQRVEPYWRFAVLAGATHFIPAGMIRFPDARL